MKPAALIALDWGTTSLRAALLDAQGQVLEQRASAQGILNVAPGQFPAVFEAITNGWVLPGGPLCLMAGMVGSRQGWQEAPYLACPTGFDGIASALTWVDTGSQPIRAAIVPGLSCEHDGTPDVMRGEETQVFGALQRLGRQDATLVLPGTHSKWVTALSGHITGFRTFMTGEVYALLRQHSILARMMPAHDGALDGAAFDRGVAHALASDSLLGTAFSARTLALFERLAAAALPSYLSGLVIGEELRAQPALTGPVVIMGSPALTQRYERALALRGIRTQGVGEEATWRGLWAIAQSLEPRP